MVTLFPGLYLIVYDKKTLGWLALSYQMVKIALKSETHILSYFDHSNAFSITYRSFIHVPVVNTLDGRAYLKFCEHGR